MPSVITLFYFLLFSVQHLSYGQQFVPFQSMKYFIEKEYAVTSYSEAEESCQNKSANLAVVNSQKIQEFLVQKINFSELQNSPYSFLIGLKRFSKEKYGLRWIDGSPLNYSNWYQAEPNYGNDGGGCVILGWFHNKQRQSTWSDVACRSLPRTFYICQQNIDAEDEITATGKISTINKSTKAGSFLWMISMVFGVSILLLI